MGFTPCSFSLGRLLIGDSLGPWKSIFGVRYGARYKLPAVALVKDIVVVVAQFLELEN